MEALNGAMEALEIPLMLSHKFSLYFRDCYITVYYRLDSALR